MQLSDIDLLKCIDCQGGLIVKESVVESGEIVHGHLKCTKCSRNYPVIEHVGIFFKREVLRNYLKGWEIKKIEELGYFDTLEGSAKSEKPGEKLQLAVAENWEYQWEKVWAWTPEEDIFGKDLFWKFIPIKPEEVTGKTVFVACGGRGREAFHLSQFAPRKIIVNEIGVEIYSIRKLIPGDGRNVVLLRSDITHHPVKEEKAEITICDHALQHVLDHEYAFTQMVHSVKKRGLIGICVYSYENNFLMTHLIEPLKKVLHLLPLKGQRLLAFFPAVLLTILIGCVYIPLSKTESDWVKKIPLFEHMIFWSGNCFKLNWMACFDLIHAPIAYYFRKDEINNLVRENNLAVRTLANTHGTVWSLVAHKAIPESGCAQLVTSPSAG